jgi:hypothetical protein
MEKRESTYNIRGRQSIEGQCLDAVEGQRIDAG